MDTNLSKKEKREHERLAIAKSESLQKRNELIKRVALWGLVVVAIVGSVWGLAKLGASSLGTNSSVENYPPLADEVTPNERIRGNANAKVTLVEYSDFQCPACGSAYPFVKQLEAKYPNDVRVVYRHYPLPQHLNAMAAAEAAEAAGNQGKFWEMHDMLFEKQLEWAEAKDPKPFFESYAKTLGLDTARFTSDSDSSAVKNAVIAASASGNRSSVDSTPTFFLNGSHLVLQSFNDLDTAVQLALKK